MLDEVANALQRIKEAFPWDPDDPNRHAKQRLRMAAQEAIANGIRTAGAIVDAAESIRDADRVTTEV